VIEKGLYKMKTLKIYKRYNNERGVSAVLIAILMFVFLAFAALALDLSHIFVAQNELQNAADAGALAGARFLYNDNGTAVNPNANQIGHDAAIANNSENSAVEVNWNSGNTGDVLRGHWSFAAKSFTSNASLEPVDLWNVSDEELDANTNFINAVQVTTRREATPIVAFFARIFGIEDFQRTATAVAYIGFSGTLHPGDVDQPIAICEESILNKDDEYDCNIGRMINSGQGVESSETGGWTSFNQDDPCTGGTNAQEVRGLVCADGNPEDIFLGKDMATNGGEIQSAFSRLIDCWMANRGDPPQSWNLTLPVVSCPGNNVGTCETVQGAVNLNIVWITGPGEDPEFNDAPTQMGDWSNTDPNGQVRWNDFVNHFMLQNVDGSPAPYAKKSIYFLPDCSPHELEGTTGGHNFGVLARIPVLVH
jgi:Flp pilus assembly protein TadG